MWNLYLACFSLATQFGPSLRSDTSICWKTQENEQFHQKFRLGIRWAHTTRNTILTHVVYIFARRLCSDFFLVRKIAMSRHASFSFDKIHRFHLYVFRTTLWHFYDSYANFGWTVVTGISLFVIEVHQARVLMKYVRTSYILRYP